MKLDQSPYCYKCKGQENLYTKNYYKGVPSAFICKTCHLKLKKAYERTPKGKEVARRVHKKYSQTEAGKLAQNKSNTKMYYKHHEKELARKAARRALKSGVIKKSPCFSCHSTPVEMHHTDYRNQLDVVFLCRSCHSKIHRSHIYTAFQLQPSSLLTT